MTTATRIDRHVAMDWYQRNRDRTATLFEVLHRDALYAQPIALRHPIVFYVGHLPAFSLNTLVKRALGEDGIDADLERLFARGIDPDEPQANGAAPAWPDWGTVQAFVAEADARVMHALATADLDQPGHPLLTGADAVWTILEHEAMHQETLLYMWHRLPFDQKRAPTGYQVVTGGPGLAQAMVEVPAGTAHLGSRRGEVPFAWDNELPGLSVDVPSFRMQARNVTNADMLAFVEAGGYRREDLWSGDDWAWVRSSGIEHPAFWMRDGQEWLWRGMFEALPLPAEWPVYVSQAEASAYARWTGQRLPTEAEYQRAAYGSPGDAPRRYPWGDAPPTSARGVFDFSSWEPEPAGSHPDGQSAWGIHDLVGNGWEWTSTIFEPFPGFTASASYPEYSADFFDRSHYVIKGASQATARELLRPGFRNWFRPRYPYVYAAFRLAEDV
jgi:gamma-glutamyl hercynylcysteine S-oxide synthase